MDVISANDTYVNGSRFRKNYFLCLNLRDQSYQLKSWIPHYLLSSVPLDENDKFCQKNGLQHISIRNVFNKSNSFTCIMQTLVIFCYNADQRTQEDYKFLNETIFDRDLASLDLWNTIKKNENWQWIDTDQRILEIFPETEFLDLTWRNENILDESMSNEFIAFYAGIEGTISS